MRSRFAEVDLVDYLRLNCYSTLGELIRGLTIGYSGFKFYNNFLVFFSLR